jgi:hypothetical protein
MFNGLVFDTKVKPLVMGVGITIRSNVQMKLVLFFYCILQISTLKTRLETYKMLNITRCFTILTENDLFLMSIDEPAGKLSLKVVVDKDAVLEGELLW